jgi:hypothetical protein
MLDQDWVRWCCDHDFRRADSGRTLGRHDNAAAVQILGRGRGRCPAGGGVALLRGIKALAKLKVHNDDQRTGIEIVKKAMVAELPKKQGSAMPGGAGGGMGGMGGMDF